MNKLLLAGAMALIAATNAHADLIPITLNQFIYDEVVQRYFFFFDEARVIPYTDENGVVVPTHGFVSRYGPLNGGIYFNTDLFSNDPTTSATIWWDFTGLPGFRLTRIYDVIEGGQEFFYQIPPGEGVIGSEVVTGIDNINIIAFFGNDGRNVPDETNTFLLSALAIGFLLLFNSGNILSLGRRH